jgi:hypothetical protein
MKIECFIKFQKAIQREFGVNIEEVFNDVLSDKIISFFILKHLTKEQKI